jgi:hypothetical protein
VLTRFAQTNTKIPQIHLSCGLTATLRDYRRLIDFMRVLVPAWKKVSKPPPAWVSRSLGLGH